MLYAGVLPLGNLLRRVIAHLDTVSPDTQHDTLLWLPP